MSEPSATHPFPIPAHYPAWCWQGEDAPGSLVLADISTPRLQPGQVLVRNAAIGLNPVDWKVLARGLPGWQPGHVAGVDGAGTVVALGAGVPQHWLGQRVAYHQGLREQGSFAAYTPIAQRALMRLPADLDMEVAASFPCPGLTAWQALEKLPERPGAEILISGAGGAVGHYLVQQANARGWAITTMSHPRHWSRLAALGARHTLPGPLQPGPLQPGSSVVEEGRYLAVIDMINAEHAAQLAPALRANGHLVAIQGRVAEWPCAPFGKAWSLHEVALGALHYYGDDADWAAQTAAGEALLRQLATSALLPEPLTTRSFAELPRFLNDLRERNFSGKALISV